MSITVSYRRISPERFAELQDNPELAEDFFYPEDPTTVDLLDRLVEGRLQNNHKLAQQLSDELAEQLSQADDVLHLNNAGVDTDNLDATENQLSIEKEWQAIHYLLTGEVAFDESQAEPPLSNVVLGGTSTQFEATYGSKYRTKKLGDAKTHLHTVPNSIEFYADDQSHNEKCSWLCVHAF